MLTPTQFIIPWLYCSVLSCECVCVSSFFLVCKSSDVLLLLLLLWGSDGVKVWSWCRCMHVAAGLLRLCTCSSQPLLMRRLCCCMLDLQAKRKRRKECMKNTWWSSRHSAHQSLIGEQASFLFVFRQAPTEVVVLVHLLHVLTLYPQTQS